MNKKNVVLLVACMYVGQAQTAERRLVYAVAALTEEARRKEEQGRIFVDEYLTHRPVRVVHQIHEGMTANQRDVILLGNPYDPQKVLAFLKEEQKLGTGVFFDFVTSLEKYDKKTFGEIIEVFPLATLKLLVHEGLDPFATGSHWQQLQGGCAEQKVGDSPLYSIIAGRVGFPNPKISAKYQQAKDYLESFGQGARIAAGRKAEEERQKEQEERYRKELERSMAFHREQLFEKQKSEEQSRKGQEGSAQTVCSQAEETRTNQEVTPTPLIRLQAAAEVDRARREDRARAAEEKRVAQLRSRLSSAKK